MVFGLALVFAFLIAGLLGSKRKIGFVWSLVACIFLSPLLGLIITLCSEKLPPEEDIPEGAEEKPFSENLAENNVSPAEAQIEAPDTVEASAETVINDDSTTIDY